MFIDRINERYFAFDGKIILTADIMIPRQADDAPERFLTEVSSACHGFLRNSLYPDLNARYVSDYGKHKDFSAYKYSFIINELYSGEEIISFAYYSLLINDSRIISCGLRTVTFDKESILPESLICGKRRAAHVAFGADGKPVLAKLTDGNLKIIPI